MSEFTSLLKEIEDWANSPHVEMKHKADLEPVTRYPIADNCLTMLIGATGSGKSFVLGEIFKRVNFDIIFFISPTASLDQTYQEKPYDCDYYFVYNEPNEGVEAVLIYLLKRIKINHYINYMETLDKENIRDKQLTLDKIDDLLDGFDIEMFRMNNRIAVVLDDCGYQTKQMKGGETPLSQLSMIRRHLGVSVFVSLQSYTQVDKNIRRQASDVIMTKKVSTNDLKEIYKELTNLPKKDIITVPRYFVAIVEGLMANKEYSSVHFLYRGTMCDFQNIDEGQFLPIIKDYENRRRR